MSATKELKEKVRAGRDCLIPLTEESDDEWSLHIRNSSFIVTFSDVTRMNSGGLHCWSEDDVRLFVSEEDDDFVPEEITDKLVEIAEGN
jgi:hypothetical protein